MIIADFESTFQGWIHSISYVPVSFHEEKKWKSRGRGNDPIFTRATKVTFGQVTTIVIRDVIAQPAVKEMNDVQKKLAGSFLDAAEFDQREIYVMDFRNALVKFLNDSQGVWLAHSIDNDIDFLVSTDKKLQTGIFSKDPKAYPNTCCRLPEWSSVSKVCTQQIITRRCPQFWAQYLRAGYSSARLCDLSEFVGCPPQTHTSARDVMHLGRVLERAFEIDKFHIEENCSYMIHKPVQTFSPLNQRTL